MRNFVWKAFINTMAFYLVFLIFPSLSSNSPLTGLLAGFVLAIINSTIRPLLILVTSPLILLTFGLFTLIINAWMVMLTDKLIGQMSIPGFWFSLLISLLISILTINFNIRSTTV